MEGEDRRLDARSIALGTVTGESNGPHFHRQLPPTARQAAVQHTVHNCLRLLSGHMQQQLTVTNRATCSRRPRFNSHNALIQNISTLPTHLISVF